MSTRARSASDGDRARGAGALIEVLDRQRWREIDRAAAARLAQAVLDKIGRAGSALTITFIRDAAMRRLNRDYRGIASPTDVLSFAYHEDTDLPLGARAAGEPEHLGDVVIAVETAARYARELGLTFEREIERLIIHGVLHLAGYDHETDHGEMNRLERRLRKELLSRENRRP